MVWGAPVVRVYLCLWCGRRAETASFLIKTNAPLTIALVCNDSWAGALSANESVLRPCGCHGGVVTTTGGFAGISHVA